jgi:putative CocE/NonD family hydrolase
MLGHSRAIVIAIAALAAAAPAGAEAAEWTSYDRPAQYAVATDRDVPVTMRDGTVLRADVYRPDAPGRFPVIVTQTPYNKLALGVLANRYLVERGYVHVMVDVRGTGGSQGAWDSFGESEQRDGYELVEWAADQPWSDGKVGTYGFSYMGLNQIQTAGQRPPHLRAAFPIVPMADAYRDIVFSGGQLNVSFIPLWLGLVTATAILPPTYTLSGSSLEALLANAVDGVSTLLSHLAGAGTFQLPVVLRALTGGDIAYDGPFYRTRSPIEVADEIQVPTFIVGGLHDLFQRGEPLLYEEISDQAPTRLLMGPWTHLQGSLGLGLEGDGMPSLNSIALRWFDRWLKGIDTDVEAIPKVTQYVLGEDRYQVQPDWPDPGARAERLYLRDGRSLSEQPPASEERPERYLQQPLSGICSLSTEQWTAGLLSLLPCDAHQRLGELGGVSYRTPPLSRDLHVSGPIGARLWISTTRSDAPVTVMVADESPSGASAGITNGWLSASFRALDEQRSRRLDGQVIQPYHPFTRESVQPVTPGEPMRLDVEIFPTDAVIKAGHRLRITVAPSDFPHTIPPLPQLLDSLAGLVSVHHDPTHASSITLPVVGGTADAPPAGAGASQAAPAAGQGAAGVRAKPGSCRKRGATAAKRKRCGRKKAKKPARGKARRPARA